MVEQAAGEVRYKAFLSYSHRDAAVARRLHRRLETYRLPKRLVGTETAYGIVPDRLWPIFRDREELPAAGDLSETVRAALVRSEALIILCSPDAVASLWVAEEIRTFRQLHPDRPILAAILSGDPPACFPEALRFLGADGVWHEPLATDLRPQGDGPQLGLLKLVAGVTGVGLDDLVQRDAARRIRRVTAVTVAASIAVLIMSALTAFALDARSEAERQRAEAEGLIEFMLTDLRRQLRSAEGLEVLTSVNRRALAYYGDQPELGGLAAGSIERRARILRLMGEDDVRRGDYDAAISAFREAHRTTADQLERAPNDPHHIFAHAQSEYWVGRVHELRRDWPVAQQQYARYAAAAERLIAIAPDNPDYMMEMGWAALNQGIVRLNGIRDPARAQQSFEMAVTWFGRAASVPPRNDVARREQANAYAWLADSFYERGMFRQSLAARRLEYRIKEQLQRADPANLERIFDMAIAERAVSQVSVRAGEPGPTQAMLARSHERARLLTARDPRNAEWLLLRTKIECDLLRETAGRRGDVNGERLRTSIRAAGATLSAQQDMRVSEIRDCLSRAAPAFDRSNQGAISG